MEAKTAGIMNIKIQMIPLLPPIIPGAVTWSRVLQSSRERQLNCTPVLRTNVNDTTHLVKTRFFSSVILLDNVMSPEKENN